MPVLSSLEINSPVYESARLPATNQSNSTQRILPNSTIAITSLPIHAPAAFAVCPDGSRALIACKNVLCVQNLIDRQSKEITVPRKHLNFDVSIARFNPVSFDKFLLASNLGIDLYQIENDNIELLHCNKKAHSRFIIDLDWNYRNQHVFATGSRNEIGFWDTRQAKIAQLKGLPGTFTGVSQLKWCRLEEQFLAAAQGNDIKLWDFRNLAQSLADLTAVQTTSIHSLQWSSLENTILVSGNEDFSVKIIDLNSCLPTSENYTVSSVNVPGEKLTADSTRITKRISTSSVEPKLIFDKNPVLKAKFAPFARTFTTCDKVENVLRLYSSEELDQTPLQKYEAESGKIVDFEWTSSMYNYQLFSLSSDKTIRVWTPTNELLQSLNVKTHNSENVPFVTTEDADDKGRSNSFNIAAANLGVTSNAISSLHNEMFSNSTVPGSTSPVHTTTGMPGGGPLLTNQHDLSFRNASQEKRFNENLSLSPPTFNEQQHIYQPIQSEDYYSYSSPNNKIMLQLECQRSNRLIHVNVLNCLSQYTAFELKLLDSNNEISVSFDTSFKPASMTSILFNRKHSELGEKVKPFISGNIKHIFETQKNMLSVDSFPDNCQQLGLFVADAVLSACSIFAKTLIQKEKDQNWYSIPCPKTSGGRFSAGRVVIFAQSFQQPKQVNILPTGQTPSKTPPNLAEYCKSRSCLRINAQIQISVICQEFPELFEVDSNLARDYKVFSDTMSREDVCEHNRDVCCNNNKQQLANMWDMLSVIAKMMSQFDQKLPDSLPMSVLPLGRPLIESYIDYYLKLCDIQTVAMIVSVFFEEEKNDSSSNGSSYKIATIEHMYSNSSSKTPIFKKSISYQCRNNSPDLQLETNNGFYIGQGHQKTSSMPVPVSSFPDQFKRDDLNVGGGVFEAESICESPDDKKFMRYLEDQKFSNEFTEECRKNKGFGGDSDGESISGMHVTDCGANCSPELETTCLDSKQQCRYDIFKLMYGDILYRWDLLIQRCEIVKSIRSNVSFIPKTPHQIPSEGGGKSKVAFPHCSGYLYKIKCNVRQPSPSPPTPLSRHKGAGGMTHSPSFNDGTISPKFTTWETFMHSKASEPRNSAPNTTGASKNTLGTNFAFAGNVMDNKNIEGRKSRTNLVKIQAFDNVPVAVNEYSSESKINATTYPDFYCVICRQEVRGLFSVCFKCGHGGHPKHLREWFSSASHCAFCGTECVCAQLCPTLN